MFKPSLMTLSLVVVLANAAAAAADDVTLAGQVVAGVQQAHMTLKRQGNRFVPQEGARLKSRLSLAADVSAADPALKIVASELVLKDSGHEGVQTGAGMPAATPLANRIGSEELVDFAFETNGVLAQNASAACSAAFAGGGSKGEVRTTRLIATAVWTVTTGRFNFPWRQYDQVAIAADARDNPDFYGERQTKAVDIALPVELSCIESSDAKIASKDKPEIRAKTVAKTTPVETDLEHKAASTPAPAPDLASEVSASTSQTAHLVQAVASADEAIAPVPQRPACGGGMIRETSVEAGGYVCLCPGNTQRVSTGANAYSCQKIDRR